ncbi:flagellar hook-basal body complex protein FliE [Paracoccus zhejiangensis]|uniref:Flagellar hook-basal body protein FliE n=1 Tax=Paracoccus zhejiangensis TaxID=1077935 RepID=A0A2H5F2B2_9RHOB|nr:flagellar hook-basal body complex protein FliE [Paracoccus zhejiangensis]AUH65691.1 flagellar hook-basal body protein FliE [Paracoccus zhejiangensis]
MITAAQAGQAYSAARSAITGTAKAAPPSSGPDFAAMAQDFTRVMDRVDNAATGAMTGTAPTHQLVQSLAEAELALQTVVAIRDKVVEAYQEILRMPV